MEPMAYLMMLGNMTFAFAYFGLKGKELDQSSLQERWFHNTAKKMYAKRGFDFELYNQLETDILELRNLVKSTV